MIKRVREEKGGFTLAELLIVVAIILVLVAVAVPVFTGAMDKANIAVGQADARAAKSEASVMYALDANKTTTTDLTTAQKYEVAVDKHGNVSKPEPVNDFDAGTKVVSETTTDDDYKAIGVAAQTDDGVVIGVTIKGEDLSTPKA